MRVDATDVRRSANLLAMLPAGVPLRKTASNRWSTVCPFHEDTKPSLSVSFLDAGWVFNCFACGEKGDVISWVMKLERLNFRAALDFLAGIRDRVPMPYVPRPPRETHKSHVLACDFRGCANRAEVDLADMPHVGEQLHAAWKRVGEQWFCGDCCGLMTLGYTRKPTGYDGGRRLLADWVRAARERR